MELVFEHAKSLNIKNKEEWFEHEKNNSESFYIYQDFRNKFEYFPASILEKTDKEGDTHNLLRIYNESSSLPDLEIPDDSIIALLKKANPIMMYCITMYSEDFSQLIQSLTGCIRSIIELNKAEPKKYTADRFGIVLIADGIDKLKKDFAGELK